MRRMAIQPEAFLMIIMGHEEPQRRSNLALPTFRHLERTTDKPEK